MIITVEDYAAGEGPPASRLIRTRQVTVPDNFQPTIEQRLRDALATNRQIVTRVDAYLGSAAHAPTAAEMQSVMQALKALAQQNIGLARLLTQQLESPD